jgi:hypothetical protein
VLPAGHAQLDGVHERSLLPPPILGGGGPGNVPPNVMQRVNELQGQLQYATMVRANYEKQLHQLSGALQAERLSKGRPPARVASQLALH